MGKMPDDTVNAVLFYYYFMHAMTYKILSQLHTVIYVSYNISQIRITYLITHWILNDN